MCVAERLTYLCDISQQDDEILVSFLGDELVETFPVEVLHDEVRSTIDFAVVMNGYDIFVLQLSGCLRFLAEAFQQIGVFGVKRRDDLDRNGSADRGVAGFVDNAHAPSANLSNNIVFSNLAYQADGTDVSPNRRLSVWFRLRRRSSMESRAAYRGAA